MRLYAEVPISLSLLFGHFEDEPLDVAANLILLCAAREQMSPLGHARDRIRQKIGWRLRTWSSAVAEEGDMRVFPRLIGITRDKPTSVPCTAKNRSRKGDISQ
jgi:hypothetical protein